MSLMDAPVGISDQQEPIFSHAGGTKTVTAVDRETATMTYSTTRLALSPSIAPARTGADPLRRASRELANAPPKPRANPSAPPVTPGIARTRGSAARTYSH